MELTHSTTSLFSSRAILVVGALGLTCLVLTALLILQIGSHTDPDAQPAGLAALAPSQTPAAEPQPRRSEPAVAQAPTQAPAPAGSSLSWSGSRVMHEPVGAALQSAGDEPVLQELATFIASVHEGIEQPAATLNPVLASYLQDLIRRLNENGQVYHAKLFAPELDTAFRRVEALLTLFRRAGLQPSLLILTGHTGPASVVVERA